MRPCQVQTRTHHHPCTAAVFRCRSAEARFLTSNFPARNTYLTRAGMYWGRGGEGRGGELDFLKIGRQDRLPSPVPSRSPSALIFGTLNHPRVTDALGIFSLKFFRSIRAPSPSPEAKPATFWSFHPPSETSASSPILAVYIRRAASSTSDASPLEREPFPVDSSTTSAFDTRRILAILEQARRRTLNIDVSSSEIPRHQL